MSESIWSYLAYQCTIDTDPDDWYEDCDFRPTSFRAYLLSSGIFSTKCQFIEVGKVIDYRKMHHELKPWRSGYICFYSLNFIFEAMNIELIVALRQLLQVPSTNKLIPQITHYLGTKKEAFDNIDSYFKQYNNHVTIKGVHFVILQRRDLAHVSLFSRKINMEWVDHQHETWERIRPANLISDDDD